MISVEPPASLTEWVRLVYRSVFRLFHDKPDAVWNAARAELLDSVRIQPEGTFDGNLNTEMLIRICNANLCLRNGCDLRIFIEDVAVDILANGKMYLEAYDAYQKVVTAAALAEIAVWFGRPDLATEAELARRSTLPQPSRHSPESEDAHRIEPGPGAVRTYYAETCMRGHEFRRGNFQALLWGAAGRVLITLRDPDIHAGANVTLIFDETSQRPRGGIQSIEGHWTHAVQLIEQLVTPPIQFVPNDGVTLPGL